MAKFSIYIKILVGFSLLGISFQIIRHSIKVAHFFYNGLFDPVYSNSNILTNPVANGTLSLFKVALFVYLLSLLVKFIRLVIKTENVSVFTKMKQKIFLKIGNGLILYSIGMFILEVTQKFLENNTNLDSLIRKLGMYFGESIIERIPLLILALFMLIIADLINDGYSLKKENDLTI